MIFTDIGRDGAMQGPNLDATLSLAEAVDIPVILSGGAVAATWARVPDPSRQSYGTSPAPGTPIAEALAYAKPADPDSFAVLRCAVQAMDIVHLGPQHRRARFDRADGWAGQWLAP